MKWFFRMMLPALVLVSCSKEGGSLVEVDPISTKEKVEVVSHEKMELGRKLENPYSVKNVGEALATLYPTRASVDVPVTDRYVRFLPKNTEEYNRLSDLGVEMLDHPMDREILKDGDYYHDPAVPEDEITWQYAVVPSDFEFPQGIDYEVLDECFIPDEDVSTRGLGDLDWESIERKAFEITDNADLLVPETRAKSKPSGRITIVDDKLNATLFRRCVVNNAAYDYFKKCQTTGVVMPPKNLRFWILNILRPSSTLMMHHGALLDNKLVSKYIGKYTAIVRIFAPDITIGSKGKNGNYSELYSTTIHEMAHASHFQKVGTDYWKKYATYILTSYISTGDCYGTGNGDNAGYCEIGEMWAYYIENMLYKERYGSNPGFGANYWFKPQILMDLENGGVHRSDICASLGLYSNDIASFKSALLENCSGKATLINKTFSKYSK